MDSRVAGGMVGVGAEHIQFGACSNMVEDYWKLKLQKQRNVYMSLNMKYWQISQY